MLIPMFRSVGVQEFQEFQEFEEFRQYLYYYVFAKKQESNYCLNSCNS